MKTRAQLRLEAQKEAKKSSLKKTKKQILQEKQAKNIQTKGKGEGRKKVKKQVSPDKQTKQTNPKSKGKGKQQQSKDKSSQKENKRDLRRSSLRKKPSLSIPDTKPSAKNDQATNDKNKKEEVKKEHAKGKSNQKDSETNQDADKVEIKKFQFKGKVPIDEHCSYVKNPNYHVLQHGGKVYSATLNQTSVQNNNNKFYILQIIQSSDSPSCYFFTRWGRVGVVGQNSMIGPFPIARAISFYKEKFKEKHNKGNYREVQLNYENQDDEEKDKKSNQQKQSKQNNENDKQKIFQESKLSKPLKRFIELIFDLNMMNRQMVQIGYNVSKMPLGKLSKDNIKHGYSILQKLVDQLKGKARRVMIEEFTNDFYSFIPHDFGFNKMHNFILDSEVKVKKKIEMLESLAQIKVATNLISSSSQDINKLDSNYKKLKRQMKDIDPKSQLFNTLNNYLQSTHAASHNSYSLEIEDLFQLSNQAEDLRYTRHIDNKMLLWHGSRLTNFVGILSQGLRIAPPEAPVTGYMFGKGVYFADMSSKSANYCFTSRDNSTGILLLCQVALGNMNEKYHADYYASNLPAGKHSTIGLGRTVPNSANAVSLSNGVVIPMGPGESTTRPGCSLQYNEYIVYDIAQIRIKYLLRTKFNYKKTAFGY